MAVTTHPVASTHLPGVDEPTARRLDRDFFRYGITGCVIGMIVGAVVVGGLIVLASGGLGDGWAVGGTGAIVGSFFGIFFGSWAGIVVFDAKQPHDG